MRRPLVGGEDGARHNPERGALTWHRSPCDSTVAWWVMCGRIIDVRRRCRPRDSLNELIEGVGVPSYVAPHAHLLADHIRLLELLRRYEVTYELTWHAGPVWRAMRTGDLEEQVSRAYRWGLVYLPPTLEARRSVLQNKTPPSSSER